jgi:hypothetical protein
MPSPLLTMIAQRHEGDCVAAALSMLISVSYEEALLALDDPAVLSSGAWLTQIVRAADKFGVTLKQRNRWKPETHEGIARVRTKSHAHAVVVRRGLVFNTDHKIWVPDEYLSHYRAKFGALLEICE